MLANNNNQVLYNIKIHFKVTMSMLWVSNMPLQENTFFTSFVSKELYQPHIEAELPQHEGH